MTIISVIQGFMSNITQMSLATKLTYAIDVVLLVILAFKYMPKFNFLQNTGYLKWYKRSIWFACLAILLNLKFVPYFLAIIIAGGALIPFIVYPAEAREYLDNTYGRRVDKKRQDTLLSRDSLHELALAVMELSRHKYGSTILIAKGDDLNDVIASGYALDEPVNKDFIVWLFAEGSPFNKGALVIKDDRIIAVNGKLRNIADANVIRNTQISKRTRLIIGQVLTGDSIGIVTQGESGLVQMAGHLDGQLNAMVNVAIRDRDLRGIDVPQIERKINDYLHEQSSEIAMDDAQNVARKRQQEAGVPSDTAMPPLPPKGQKLTKEQKKQLKVARRQQAEQERQKRLQARAEQRAKNEQQNRR